MIIRFKVWIVRGSDEAYETKTKDRYKCVHDVLLGRDTKRKADSDRTIKMPDKLANLEILIGKRPDERKPIPHIPVSETSYFYPHSFKHHHEQKRE